MFNRRAYYVTHRIQETLDQCLTTLMWIMLDDMDGTPRADLQVFDLSDCDGQQKIVHTQEVPEYRKEFVFPMETTVTATVVIVDDGERLVMTLADEYSEG